MRALINTDVLLARFLRQEGFAEDADRIFQAAKEGKIEGLVTALSVMDVYRATRQERAPIVGLEQAVIEGKEHVREILDTFEVIPLDREVLEQALSMGGQDYRNNTLIASAEEHEAAAIITWDEQLQADQAAAASGAA